MKRSKRNNKRAFILSCSYRSIDCLYQIVDVYNNYIIISSSSSVPAQERRSSVAPKPCLGCYRRLGTGLRLPWDCPEAVLRTVLRLSWDSPEVVLAPSLPHVLSVLPPLWPGREVCGMEMEIVINEINGKWNKWNKWNGNNCNNN